MSDSAAPDQRREVIATLIAEGALAADKVAPLLSSPDASVRAAAVYVIASVRAQSKADEIGLLTSDASERVRIQAAEALGALGSPRSVPVLARLAASDSSSDVRVRAISSLGRIDSPAAVKTIRRMVTEPRNDAEFQAAAIAAAHRAIVDLEQQFADVCFSADRSDRARSAAVMALGMMKAPGSLETATKLLGDSSPSVRFNAVGALDELQEHSTAAALVSTLNNHAEENFVRIRAASALAHLGTRESLAALRSAVLTGDEFMAMHSLVALSQADQREAQTLAPALRARAHDPFITSVADRIARGLSLPWGQR